MFFFHSFFFCGKNSKFWCFDLGECKYVCLFVSFFFSSWNNCHKISPNFTRNFQYDDEHIFNIFIHRLEFQLIIFELNLVRLELN
jgi:hypothetical protein